jgi:hypothetical protein
MEHPDYRKISDHFHKPRQWDDTEPFLFDDMPDSFKDNWPSLKDFCIYNLLYASANTHYLLGHRSYTCEHVEEPFEGESVLKSPRDWTVMKEEDSDESISENITFRYPLVRKRPSSDIAQKRDRVTIVLHGLNEFSYRKYIPWACQILLHTDAPVALFPLTFSITRASSEWVKLKQSIRTQRQEIENSGQFNAIISERLQARPQRFFWGAIQSYWDIVDLVRLIRANKHPHFAWDARIDFLGFSSGGYLALALLAVNPEGLFSKSRACLFASCVEMRNLGPGSPYTIDRATEKATRDLYVEGFDSSPNKRMKHWLEEHLEGRWLSSFGGLSVDRTERLSRLRELAHEQRLLAIANCNDRIMPPGAMLDALQGDWRNTGVPFVNLDLGIHENPFVCPSYEPKGKYLVIPLDVERYGGEFEKFIHAIATHLNKSIED